jgi:hypothetical protein
MVSCLDLIFVGPHTQRGLSGNRRYDDVVVFTLYFLTNTHK